MLNSLFPSHWSTLKKLIWLKAAQGGGGGLTTLTGSIVSFTAKKTKAIDSLVVTIASESGVTGANVNHVGKNLLDLTVYDGGSYNPTVGSTQFNLTKSADANQFTDNGDGTFSISLTTNWSYRTIICPIKGLQQIGFSANISCVGGSWSIGYLNKDFVVTYKFNNTNASKAFHEAGWYPGADDEYLFIVFTNRSAGAMTITITNPQVEVGTEITSYEAFSGTVYSASWQTKAGAITNGTYDFISGVLKSNGNSYQLTGQSISTLEGENNIWADIGDVSVTAPSNIIVT